MKRFIIFDLDDTLLNNEKKITPYTNSVLAKLRKMGCVIVINTARSHLFNEEYTRSIKADYTILNGGAAILDSNFREIYTKTVSREKISAMLPRLLELSQSASIQSKDILYANDKSFKRPDVEYCDFAKLGCHFDAYKIIANISEENAELLAEEFDLQYVSYFGGPLKRFSHKEATKALANRYLTNLLGGSPDDAIVFGDDHGDVEMINEAGVGIVMKNAKDDVKALCKNVSEYTNDEDGVARFLAAYFSLEDGIC